jgi:type 2 lantibiotic biosynthesis protein LanM
LGERDFATQKWIVEASLATLATRDDEPPNESFGVGPERDRVIRPDLLRLAAAIGKRIAELAFENDDGAYWLALQPVGADAWGVAPAGIDLYGGTSGIALFLAYLGAITGDESYTLLAKRSLRAIRAELEEQLKSEARLGIGAFDGIGSAVYLLTHLGALWTEPALFAAAEELVEQLAQPISTDNRLDLLSGSAGCILSLLSLYAVHPSPMVLQRAMQCGDRLLATAQPRADAGAGWETLDQEPPLGGMSHGAAGIALSLLKLADYSAERRFRDVALAALTYDRSLFVPELRNWADLRRIEPRRATAEYPERGLDTAGPGCVVAWCHGAPGIGLARLGSLEHLDNLTVRNEIDIALNTTLQQGFAATDSLCHGALGNLELFVTATQLLHRPEDASAVQQGAAAIVERMDASGWRPAVPVGVDTPGFMTGLAGMGYELLRLADPDNVPSVLLLAPPCPGRSG